MSAYLTDHATGAVYELAGDFTVSSAPPVASVAVPAPAEPTAAEEQAPQDSTEATEEAAGTAAPLAPSAPEEVTLEVGSRDPSLSQVGQPDGPARA